MSDLQANRPTNINVQRESGTLTIDWADRHRSEHDATTLRLMCPCAFCRGEAGQSGWLDTNPVLTADQIQIVAAGLVGQYALNLSWGDGHDTGYYTWESLRTSCTCPACSATRASR